MHHHIILENPTNIAVHVCVCVCVCVSYRWCIHKAYQADVSISLDFLSRLGQHPRVKFYARESSTPKPPFSTYNRI